MPALRFWNLLDFLFTPGEVLNELLTIGNLCAASQTSRQGWKSCLDTLVVEKRARLEESELNYLLGLPSPSWIDLEEAWEREAHEANMASLSCEEFHIWWAQTHLGSSDSVCIDHKRFGTKNCVTSSLVFSNFAGALAHHDRHRRLAKRARFSCIC